MPALPPSTVPLLIGASSLMFAGGLNGLILPVRGAQEGFSAFSLGLLGTGWAIGFIAGCLIVPPMVQRVGHIRAFGAMTALAAVSILMSLLLMHPLAWVPLRALAGFCFAGAQQIMESWLNEGSGKDTRGRVFGVYAMVNLISNTAGQMVLPLGDTSAATFFVLGAVFYTLALIPTALYATHQPRPLTEVSLDIGRLWRNSPVAVFGIVLIGLANSTFGTLAAVYGNQIGMSVTAIAVFVSATLVAGALAQVPVGFASDRVDRRLVLIAVCVGAVATSAWFITAAPRDIVPILIGAGFFGAFIHTMYPLLISHANDHAPEGDFLRTAGGLLLLFGIGSVAGPLIAGGMMSLAGPEGMFVTIAAAHVTVIAFAAWRIVRRPAPEHGEYVRVPTARYNTPQSLVLNPQAADSDQREQAQARGTAAPSPDAAAGEKPT
ncbi:MULTISPECIES: MFS transporter [unclassified Roseitalea]|uniref:MFS transporter n=1 Tax=unclassified Roseitalea TaxID=2639107 RepID=UPI00273EDCB5|nr:MULTISPECIES: MFS transporter [unclassified Roseitalea]